MDIVTYALCKKYTNTRVEELQALGPFIYKGSVPTYDDLPTTGRKKGHVWTVEDTGDEYVWNGDAWIKFGANVLPINEVACELVDGTTKTFRVQSELV